MKEDWYRAYEKYLAEIKAACGHIAPIHFEKAIKHADEVVISLSRAERLKPLASRQKEEVA